MTAPIQIGSITGADAMIPMEPGYSYTPSTGKLWTRRWKCLHAKAKSEADLAIAAGATFVDVSPLDGSPFSTLTVSDTGPSGSVDANVAVVFSLVTSMEDVSQYENPKFSGVLAALTDPDGLANLKRDIEAFANGGDFPEGATDWADWLTQIATINSLLPDLARLMAEGKQTIPKFPPTLRKSVIVQANSSYAASWTNIGKIYTSPGTGTWTVDGHAVPTAIIGSVPEARWLKTGPNVDPMSDGRYQITQSYIMGDWDSRAFDDAT